jgi:nucleoside-diphosphate-sugar epimerase
MPTRESTSSPFRGARVVVLGATGFIGRWVARALTEHGADLVLAHRGATSAAAIFARFGVRGAVARLDAPAALEEMLREVRPAVVFDLAGYGIDPAQSDARIAHAVNAELPRRLVRALAEARDPGWPHRALVHAGSALEYGDAGGTLAEDGPARPTTTYGRTKLAGTEVLAREARAVGVPALTARLFTVYGPGERPDRLLPALLAARATGAPVALTEGRQRRDFTYVADVAEGMLRLALSAGPPGEVVNLATGRLTAVRDFAATAQRLLGLAPERLRFGVLPVRAGEMRHDPIDLRRLRARTGWVPPTDVAAGIAATLRFDAEHGVLG